MGRKSRGNRRVSPVCVVSYLEACRLIATGDRGFLAHVQETTQETPSPGPIAVVSELQASLKGKLAWDATTARDGVRDRIELRPGAGLQSPISNRPSRVDRIEEAIRRAIAKGFDLVHLLGEHRSYSFKRQMGLCACVLIKGS